MIHSLSYLKPNEKTMSSDGVMEQNKCDKCNKCFPSSSGLRRHEREQHFEAKHSCQICGEKFVRKYKLGIHERTVHKGVPAVSLNFQCDQCSEKFTEKGVLERHVKSKHSCSSCGIELCTMRQLLEHRKNVHNAFICSSCNKSFRDGDKLRRHQNFKNCDICKELLCNEQELRKHMKSHGGDSLKCTVCEKAMSTKQKLNDHVLKRTDKSCPRCHKMFCFIADLNAHISSKHMTEKCSICKGHVLEGNLESHEMSHKKNQIESDVLCLLYICF